MTRLFVLRSFDKSVFRVSRPFRRRQQDRAGSCRRSERPWRGQGRRWRRLGRAAGAGVRVRGRLTAVAVIYRSVCGVWAGRALWHFFHLGFNAIEPVRPPFHSLLIPSVLSWLYINFWIPQTRGRARLGGGAVAGGGARVRRALCQRFSHNGGGRGPSVMHSSEQGRTKGRTAVRAFRPSRVLVVVP